MSRHDSARAAIMYAIFIIRRLEIGEAEGNPLKAPCRIGMK
jgi:hypothetical protein